MASYITRNRLGIYYFQYSYQWNAENDGIDRVVRKLFRKSLKTRNRSEALIAARYLWFVMAKIQKKYFDSSDSAGFGRAMQLVAEFEAVDKLDWMKVDEFYQDLDERDEDLLNRGIKQKIEDSGEGFAALRAKYDGLLEQVNKRQNSVVADSAEATLLLSYVIDKWLVTKSRNLEKTSYISAQGHLKDFQAIISELSGKEIKVGELTSDLIRSYCGVIESLPARRNIKEAQGKTYQQMGELVCKKISPATYHSHINSVKEFFTWSIGLSYIVNGNFETILATSRKNVKKRRERNRLNFSDDDLAKLFLSEDYLKGGFKNSSDYWVQLIGLFTGARISEICQLTISDIQIIEGVQCFNFNDVNRYQYPRHLPTSLGTAFQILPEISHCCNYGV